MRSIDLVVQAPAIASAELASIVALADAQRVVPLHNSGDAAFRLLDVRTRVGVGEFCRTAGIDCGFVPADLTRDRVRLVAMDMDSTLITIECVDEIADLLGIKPRVAAITAAAMRGEIDFGESLTRRVALLAGLPVTALQRVYDERLRLTAGAERMLAGFKAVGTRTLLVSGGFSFFADRLKHRLGLDDAVSNSLEIVDGKLTGRLLGPLIDAKAKAASLLSLKSVLCAGGGIAIAIGDGANDLPMLALADASVAYRAKPAVRAQASQAIDYCGLDALLNLFP